MTYAMSLLKRVATPLLAFQLVACTISGQTKAPPPMPGERFSYAVADAGSLGLIQVFDGGFHTYLQFADRPSPSLEIERGTSSTPLDYTADDHYIVLSGVYDQVRIRLGAHAATITNQNPPRASDLRPNPRPQAETTASDTQESSPLMNAASSLSAPSPYSGNTPPKAHDTATRSQPTPLDASETLQAMYAQLRVIASTRPVAPRRTRTHVVRRTRASAAWW